MANLAEAVDATETDWIISADLDDAISYLTVEDEIVKVTGNFPSQLDPQSRATIAPRIRVERGAGGTTAVSHVDSTVLTPLIPPSAGGGAAGLSPTWLGPFRIAHDTADISANGALLTIIQEGTAVIFCFMRLITAFNATPLEIGIQNHPLTGGWWTLALLRADDKNEDADGGMWGEYIVQGLPTRFAVGGYSQAGTSAITAHITATAGEADIYLLVVEGAL